MDGVANVARQQQTQVSNTQVNTEASSAQVSQQAKPVEVQATLKSEESKVNDVAKITSPQQVEDLVSELNEALEPIGTSLKFGVDSDDVFFVSVIDTESNEMIKRFPAERAAEFLPKMQEITGILFDSKG